MDIQDKQIFQNRFSMLRCSLKSGVHCENPFVEFHESTESDVKLNIEPEYWHILCVILAMFIKWRLFCITFTILSIILCSGWMATSKPKIVLFLVEMSNFCREKKRVYELTSNGMIEPKALENCYWNYIINALVQRYCYGNGSRQIIWHW